LSKPLNNADEVDRRLRIGGDELSIPAEQLRPVYDQAATLGLHRLIHAGENRRTRKIREAVELLGVERIGHGIAA